MPCPSYAHSFVFTCMLINWLLSMNYDGDLRATCQALAEALATPFDKASAHPQALMTKRYSLPGYKVAHA